jgi:hypothetical protein
MYRIGEQIRSTLFDPTKVPADAEAVNIGLLAGGAGVGARERYYRIDLKSPNNVIMRGTTPPAAPVSPIKEVSSYSDDTQIVFFALESKNDPRLRIIETDIPEIRPGNIFGNNFLIALKTPTNYLFAFTITVGKTWIEIYDFIKTKKFEIPKGYGTTWLNYVVNTYIKPKYPAHKIWLGTFEGRLVPTYQRFLTGFSKLRDTVDFPDSVSPLGIIPGRQFKSLQYTPRGINPTQVLSSEIDTDSIKTLACVLDNNLIQRIKYHVDNYFSEIFLYIFVNNQPSEDLNVDWDGTKYISSNVLSTYKEVRSLLTSYYDMSTNSFETKLQAASYGLENDNQSFCITAHTHPISVYKYYNAQTGAPSKGDIELVITNKRPLHLVFAYEGIYALKLLEAGFHTLIDITQLDGIYATISPYVHHYMNTNYSYENAMIYVDIMNKAYAPLIEFSFSEYLDSNLPVHLFTKNIHRTLIYQGSLNIDFAPYDESYGFSALADVTDGIIINYNILGSSGTTENVYFYLMSEKEYDAHPGKRISFRNKYIDALFRLYPNIGETYTLIRLSDKNKITLHMTGGRRSRAHRKQKKQRTRKAT